MMEKDKRKCKATEGMTLVEVIVALSVLLMVMAGSYALVIRTAALTRAARYQYLATTIGKSRLERAQTFAYQDLELFAETDVLVDDNGVPTLDGSFRRTTNIDTNIANNCTKMEVIVEIKDPQTGVFKGWSESVETKFTYLPEDEEE